MGLITLRCAPELFLFCRKPSECLPSGQQQAAFARGLLLFNEQHCELGQFIGNSSGSKLSANPSLGWSVHHAPFAEAVAFCFARGFPPPISKLIQCAAVRIKPPVTSTP